MQTLAMQTRRAPRGAHLLAMTWGVLWVVALLGNALYRLTPLAIEPIRSGSLTGLQIGLYVLWIVIMAYSEGYKGFHKRFSPRVVARAYHLGQERKPLWLILALPFCMSLFHTTRRQRIVSTVFLLAIVTVVVAVRQLSQPWRGIIDGGVVVGLGLGTASILYFYVLALTGRVPNEAALPDQPTQPG